MSYADRIARMQGELLVKFQSDNPTNKIERPIPRAGTRVTMQIGKGPRIVNGKVISDWVGEILNGTAILQSGLTRIDLSGYVDVGNGSPRRNMLDDGNVRLIMRAPFYFFGVDYSSNMSWTSNNAIVFGTINPYFTADISANTIPSILIGNYDRILTNMTTSNIVSSGFAITTIVPSFTNVYTDYFDLSNNPIYNPNVPNYTYQIRLIKELNGSQRQFIEVLVISSPPITGYSSAITVLGNLNTIGLPIDQTKKSPYNITNGTTFLNPCGSTFSLTSPPAGTSFVFSSDSTGSNWAFTNNARVNT